MTEGKKSARDNGQFQQISFGGYPFPSPGLVTPDERDELYRKQKLAEYESPMYFAEFAKHTPLPTFTIRHVEDSATSRPREMIITHDKEPYSIRAAQELAEITFTYAWPWTPPYVDIKTGVGQGGRSDRLDVCLKISVSVMHAQHDSQITIEQDVIVSHEDFVAGALCHKFIRALENMYMHEFYEALLQRGRHVTEPHQPQLIGKITL